MSDRESCHIFGPGQPLHGIGASTTLEDVKKRYDEWAIKYDNDMINYGYKTPFASVEVILEKAGENGINEDSRILDVGAGTGAIGEIFKMKGYRNIDGIDISSHMLKIARKKDCYRKLICGVVGNNCFPISVNKYDVVICIGSLVLGHINCNGINEMLHALKPGGLFFFTVRCDVIEKGEYSYTQEINKLLSEEKMNMILKQKMNYLSATNDEDPAKYCYLFGFLKSLDLSDWRLQSS